MSTIEITLTFKGVELEVEADYQPHERQTHDYPGCDESLDIEVVTVKGVDITDLIGEEEFNELSALMLEKSNEDAQDAADERASEARAEREDFYR